MKVIGKRKTFKTNNSIGVLYGVHISNAPTTGECHECFGDSVCSVIDAIHNCAISITRGGNVVNAYKKIVMLLFLHTKI